MCMKVNEGEWREMNVYELMQISIGQRVTALRLGAIPVFNAMSTKFEFSFFNMAQCVICSPVWLLYRVVAQQLQRAHTPAVIGYPSRQNARLSDTRDLTTSTTTPQINDFIG